MKKVVASGLFIYPGKVGGAEQYFYNLLKGFKDLSQHQNFTILLNKKYENQYDDIVKEDDIQWIEMNYNRVVYDYNLLSYVKNPKQFQTMFNPNYVTPFHFSKHPQNVTTIHDLQYLHYPQFFSGSKRLFQYFSHWYTLNFSKSVICISDFVKNDIIAKFGKKYAEKLKKIYVPVDFTRLEVEKSKPYAFQYILSVSAMFPHKNTITLIKAFQIFQKRTQSNVKLVLVGQNSNLKGGNFDLYHQQLNEIVKQTENIVFTGYVSDSLLGQLYQHCDFFVLPSLFEGFGIPVVEAMGLGKPVITTRCGSLEEVTLGKATYLDNPKDEQTLADLLVEFYQNLASKQAKAVSLSSNVREIYASGKISSQYMEVFYE
jgi:glycosyltransferase involved in cell wall biosynthesis